MRDFQGFTEKIITLSNNGKLKFVMISYVQIIHLDAMEFSPSSTRK